MPSWQEHLRVERAAARDEPPDAAPSSASPPPGDVARAEHEIRVLGGSDEPRHVRGVVREVAVHLEDEVGAELERAAETRPGTRGRGPPSLAVQDVHPGSSAGEPSAISPVPSGDASSITSTSSPRGRGRRAPHHRLEVLALVVRGQADQDAHACHIIASVAKTLPRNAEIADQFDLLADFLELEGSDQFRPLAYRRAAQRMRETGGSIAQLARRGQGEAAVRDRQDDRGEDRPDRRGRARSRRSRSARSASRPTSSSSCTCRASARRRRGASGRSSDVSTLDEPEAGRRVGAAAHAHRPRPEDRGERPAALATPRKEIEQKPLLGRALPAVRAVVEVLREHPAADQVSEAGSVRRLKEQVRDLDIIATASDPAALTEYFTQLPWVDEIVAKGNTKATVVSNEGLRFDLRVVPPDSYGNLLQHFTGSKAAQRRSPRGGRPQEALDLRVRHPGHGVRRGLHGPDRGGACTSGSAIRGSRPSCARTWASSRPRAKGACPQLVELARHPRRPALALDLVLGREEHDRGDGARGEAARAAPTSSSPTTRTTSARAASRRRAARSTSSRRSSAASSS